ncbi:hypothetical protein QNH36_04300 [Mesobacillus sp. AQ2]|uniref:hypothetical protein n=1 Tax=unclassified Mesobacillus TaxID=2675270 RepID=UPI00203BFC21|nr:MULTISPECIES: hypothetical protein [unclassified Mesobacillus]MCM3125506.1 hypothetical protein [Mesobacillus sp. MER 33]MCM3234450.1 hypothetical protein [Mesobacillus sp. MER 48]WHX41387.1 hypothetical protein QNH36_04300 [Mesobacillus sp. AQ2]
MFYQDYQTMAQLKQREVERRARDAWKFFEQPEMKRLYWVSPKQEQQPTCCPVPANC